MSVHMLDHSNSQGPHESDVNKNILLTLQKYSKYLYFSKLICQQLICQQLFLRGAQKLSKVRSWHFLIFSTAINQNKEIELDHVGIGLEKNANDLYSRTASRHFAERKSYEMSILYLNIPKTALIGNELMHNPLEFFTLILLD